MPMAVPGNSPVRSGSAILDACVLFPRALRDVLLRAAEQGLYRPRWTGDILDELRRNLILDRPMSQETVGRLIAAMRVNFAEAMVSDYQDLIPAMGNHEGDRHVLAAAVPSGTKTIVTLNARHFPDHALEPFGIGARSPDEFLADLLDTAPNVMVNVVQASASVLRKPPKTVAQVIDEIAKQAPNFAAAVTASVL